MPGKPTGAETIWGDKAAEGPTQPRWSGAAWWALLTLGILALGMLGWTARRYNNALVVARGLRVQLTGLQVQNGDNPNVVLHFRLQNEATETLSLDSYQFELSVNGEYLGHTQAAYKGQDPVAGRASYARDTRLDAALAPGETLDRTFTLFVEPEMLPTIQRARAGGSPIWRATGAVYAHLPGLRPLRTIGIQAGWRE